MHNINKLKIIAFIITSSVICINNSQAQSTTTSITCPGRKTIQSTINATPGGTTGIINISGNCIENIVVPYGKSIVLQGANSFSQISPLNSNADTILSLGMTSIRNLTVANASGTADNLVVAKDGGVINVSGSTLSAPNVGVVLGIFNNSTGVVANSNVTGGTVAASEVWESSKGTFGGFPNEINGPGGKKETIISSTNGYAAIGCGIGSTIAIRANSQTVDTTTTHGKITLRDSQSGISADMCSVHMVNKTDSQSNMNIISNISNNGIGLSFQRSNVNLIQATVTNNTVGMIADASNVRVQQSKFENNTNEDVVANPETTVYIAPWGGTSSFKDAFVTNKITCNAFDSVLGRAKFVIGKDSIVAPAGKVMNDISTNNTCVTIQF